MNVITTIMTSAFESDGWYIRMGSRVCSFRQNKFSADEHPPGKRKGAITRGRWMGGERSVRIACT